MRILVVDDEAALSQTLKLNLELDGYEADTAISGEQALALNPAKYDLILLDVMMDGIDGFELARRLKSDPSTSSVPIIFCSALGSDDDMVRGLDIGADDYLAKPYSMRTMLARVRSVLRRAHPRQEEDNGDEALHFEGIEVDRKARKCRVDGETVAMPRKEWELLALLMSEPGRIFTRMEVLDRVWGKGIVVCDRTIDVNIARLRQKLGKYGKHIITRSGYGYGFEV